MGAWKPPTLNSHAQAGVRCVVYGAKRLGRSSGVGESTREVRSPFLSQRRMEQGGGCVASCPARQPGHSQLLCWSADEHGAAGVERVQ